MEGKNNKASEMLTGAISKTKRKIVLITGAGMNAGMIPGWDDLMSDLFKSTVLRYLGLRSCSYNDSEEFSKWVKRKFSIYDQAYMIKNILKGQYLSLIHSNLYRDFTIQKLEKKSTLKSIASLCLDERVEAVITYNWDSLLEIQYNILKDNNGIERGCCPIHGTHLFPSDTKLPIYHVHGYIPWRSPYLTAYDAEIVFGLEEYNRSVLNGNSWHNTTQLHYLQTAICLFVGVSLRDSNMLRLLNTAQAYGDNKHVFFLCSEESIRAAIRKSHTDRAKIEIFNKYLSDLQVNLITVKKNSEIAALLDGIKGVVNEGKKNS